MYYRDHAPPHFHARYGDFAFVVFLDTWVVDGRFPPRALRHLLEWAELHADELRDDWELARQEGPCARLPLWSDGLGSSRRWSCKFWKPLTAATTESGCASTTVSAARRTSPPS